MHQEFDPRDLEPALPQAEERKRRLKLGPVLLGLVGLAGFGVIAWYAYEAGQRQANVASMPVIRADSGPTKVKPDDPGGMSVPNQDALVLNDTGSQAKSGAGSVERLLPPPEAPLPKPAAPPPPATAALPPAIGPAPATRSATPSGVRPVAPVPPPAMTPPPPTTAEAPAPIAAPRTPVETRGNAPTPLTPAPSANQTASVPAAAAPARPPVTVPKAASGSGNYRIQLAAVKSEQAATSEWSRIEKANPELASLTMTPQRVDLGDKGIFFRIQAGPLSDAAAADHLCAQLKERKQGCIVVKP
jgi:hypothetical protein